MAFHIPFNQRHAKPTGPPIYIGFERPRKKFNWWGFHGLWLSLLSLTSAGFLSPLSLLVSLNGMRRKKGPRKAAVAGVVISIVGIALAGIIVESVTRSNHQRRHRIEARKMASEVAQQRRSAQKLVASAIAELEQYKRSHDGFLPSVIDSNMLVIKHKDPWGEELRFDLKKDHGVVRSAGPDMVFETRDDIVTHVDGKVQAEASLLPL